MSKKILFLLTATFSLFFISSCHYVSKKTCCGKKSWSKKNKTCCGKSSVAGQANVTAVNGNSVKGDVFFEQVDKYKVKITANFKSLNPNQNFGFHVHEFGNCENKALMAGAHLNPWNKKHGGPKDQERHLGDLGNLKSDSKGQASYSAVVEGKTRKFFGRSVIVHALPDDLKSQPTGKAGDRIACGVVVAAMPMPPAFESKKQKTKDKKEIENTAVKTQPIQKAPVVQKASTKNTAVKTQPAQKMPIIQKASTKNTAVKTQPIQKAPVVQKASIKNTAVKTQPMQKAPVVQKASIKNTAVKIQPVTQKTSNQPAKTKTQEASK